MTVVGKEQWVALSEPAKRNLMMEFDQTLKRIFNDKSDQVHSVDLFGVEDDPDNGIENDIVVLNKYAEILKLVCCGQN